MAKKQDSKSWQQKGSITDSLVRLLIRIEDIGDLTQDIKQAHR